MNLILKYQLHSYFRAINLPWNKNKKKFLYNYQKTYDGLCIHISGIHCIIKRNNTVLTFCGLEHILLHLLTRQSWTRGNSIWRILLGKQNLFQTQIKLIYLKKTKSFFGKTKLHSPSLFYKRCWLNVYLDWITVLKSTRMKNGSRL